jgi:hypothetical protein
MDSNSNGVVRCADCVYSSGCNGTINSRNDCSKHGKWFDLSRNGLFSGWIFRYISVLGWCNADLCCDDHRSGCNGTIDSFYYCYYCYDCSEHCCNDASDDCSKLGRNLGVQLGGWNCDYKL